MSLILTGLILLLILLHLAALGDVGARWLGDRHIGRVALLLCGVMGLFFVEHLFGLGGWVHCWPLTAVIAAWVVWRQREVWRSGWTVELPLLLPLALAFLVRFVYPDIDASAEQLTDLYFVTAYMDGGRLPPPDPWLPGARFDFYYGLLPYSAALMGRWLDVSAGWAMNLSFAVVFGLIGSLVWSAVRSGARSRWLPALAVTAVVAGGTGVAPFLYAWFDPVPSHANAETRLWAGTRFIGMYEDRVQSETVRKLLGVDKEQHPDLAFENMGFYLHLGDLHPPLGGYLVLVWTLAMLVRLPAFRPGLPVGAAAPPRMEQRSLMALLGLSVPLVLAINTWVFPMQLLLVLAALLWVRPGPGREGWIWVGAGLGAGLLLLLPFLAYLHRNAVGTGIGMAPEGAHTPWRMWVLVWWPSLLLWGCLLGVALRREGALRRWAAGLVVVAVVFWIGTEWWYLDDPNGGRYERFNTTIKLWPWFQIGFVTVATMVLARQPGRWPQVGAGVALLALSSYLLPQAEFLAKGDKRGAVGQLAGDHWLQQSRADGAILQFLRHAAEGVVLEGIEGTAYSRTGALALHAGQTSLTGWPSHIGLWRGAPAWQQQNTADIRSFYEGRHAAPLSWLRRWQVRYIVWTEVDQRRSPEAFATIDASLAEAYDWRLLSRTGGQYGVWVRREQP